MAAQRASFASDIYAPSPQIQSHSRDVFGDEFAASEYADSIHTIDSRRENPFSDPLETTAPTRDYNVGTLQNQNRGPVPLQQRNSTSKNRQEMANTAIASIANVTSETQGSESNRPISLVSTATSPPLQCSATTSQTGPSHHYAMYPQNFSVSRSASIASASIAEPGASSTSRLGPAHPYNLYPQTTSSESSSEGSHRSTVVPIGFPGHNQQFTRRLGPEGEEQDIVGSFGHTEQLPPYSRFPDTYDNKAAAVGLLSATGEPAGGPSTHHSPVEMQERQPSRVDVPFTDITDGDRDARETPSPDPIVLNSEKRWKQKTWKEKRKTKLWGPISVGAALLTVGVVVLIAGICGGVIGGVLGHKHAKLPSWDPTANDGIPTHSAQITLTTTQYIDATPVSTTPGTLPTGTYEVEFYGASASSNSCVTNVSQQSAWSCTFPQTRTDMAFDVYFQNGNPYVNLYTFNAIIDYGTQPPQLIGEALAPVTDLTNTTEGVAYHFQDFYTKLVVLPQDMLEASVNQKRSAQANQPGPPPWWASRKRVVSGDQPWFCFWNDTFVEGFLYLDESSVSSSSTYASTSYVSSSSPVNTPYTSTIVSTTSCLTCGPSLTDMYATSTSTPDTSTSTAVQTAKRKRSSAAISASATSSMSPYPRIVKIEERRISQSTTPPPAVCTKMSKGGDSSFTVVTAANSPIVVTLTESDASLPSYYGDSRQSFGLDKRQDDEQECYCAWST